MPIYQPNPNLLTPTTASTTRTHTHPHPHIPHTLPRRLVEVLSGMGFREFVQKRILEPLEMHDTDFVVPLGE